MTEEHSAEPAPIADSVEPDHEAEEPDHEAEEPDHHEEPAELTALKRFWSKYVVPKDRKSVALPSQDDGSNEDGVPSEAMSSEREDLELSDLSDADVDSIDGKLDTINPGWSDSNPVEKQINGRFLTLFPPGVNPLPALPRTPSLGDAWEDGGESETRVSDPETSASEDEPVEPEERYNPGGKADDMPPCGKFGVEEFCTGPDCKVCQLALKESDQDVSGVVQSTYALAEFFENMDIGEKKRKLAHSSESALTLKTPPSKKPDFFGRAVVDTPEKKPEEKNEARLPVEFFDIIACVFNLVQNTFQ